MSLEPNLLVGTYLAGIGTALFVIAINLLQEGMTKKKLRKVL
jgi:hypothetical protein